MGIVLRRASERGGEGVVRHTFHAQAPPGHLANGLGPLVGLNEILLPPEASVPDLHCAGVETLTYVREGALAYGNSTRRPSIMQAGEFLHISPGGVALGARNASRAHRAHVFQVCLLTPPRGQRVSQEQKRFCAAARRGALYLVASPDGRRESLCFDEDACVYSSILSAGSHVVHPLTRWRGAWLHVVAGAVALEGFILAAGDGMAVTDERSVSLTAEEEETELLLVDVQVRQEPRRPEVWRGAARSNSDRSSSASFVPYAEPH